MDRWLMDGQCSGSVTTWNPGSPSVHRPILAKSNSTSKHPNNHLRSCPFLNWQSHPICAPACFSNVTSNIIQMPNHHRSCSFLNWQPHHCGGRRRSRHPRAQAWQKHVLAFFFWHCSFQLHNFLRILHKRVIACLQKEDFFDWVC